MRLLKRGKEMFMFAVIRRKRNQRLQQSSQPEIEVSVQDGILALQSQRKEVRLPKAKESEGKKIEIKTA